MENVKTQKPKKKSTKQKPSKVSEPVFEKTVLEYKFFSSRRLLAGTKRNFDGQSIPQYADANISVDIHALRLKRLLTEYNSGNSKLRLVSERAQNIGGLYGFISRLVSCGLVVGQDCYQVEMMSRMNNKTEELYYLPSVIIEIVDIDEFKEVLTTFL